MKRRRLTALESQARFLAPVADGFTLADCGELGLLVAAALEAYDDAAADRTRTLEAFQLIRVISYAADVMAGDQRRMAVNRDGLRDLFATEEPEPGHARVMWTDRKPPEALELFRFLESEGHL